MHKPYSFEISEADVSEFKLALQGGELLPAVQIEFVKPAGPGKVELYETVQLKNAHITSIKPKAGPSNGSKLFEITMTYPEIAIMESPGKTQGVNDWMN
jgi:type VI protein secretion system component Hcp